MIGVHPSGNEQGINESQERRDLLKPLRDPEIFLVGSVREGIRQFGTMSGKYLPGFRGIKPDQLIHARKESSGVVVESMIRITFS